MQTMYTFVSTLFNLLSSWALYKRQKVTNTDGTQKSSAFINLTASCAEISYYILFGVRILHFTEDILYSRLHTIL